MDRLTKSKNALELNIQGTIIEIRNDTGNPMDTFVYLDGVKQEDVLCVNIYKLLEKNGIGVGIAFNAGDDIETFELVHEVA